MKLDYDNKLQNTSYRIDELEKNLKSFISKHHVKSPFQVHVEYRKPYINILGYYYGIKAEPLLVATRSHSAIGWLLMVTNSDYMLHHARCLNQENT